MFRYKPLPDATVITERKEILWFLINGGKTRPGEFVFLQL
jgi:hypothetical protein